MKILLVDDDENLLSSIKRVLEGNGHKVFAAQQVSQALDELYESAFDLIITDLNMPELIGEHFIKVIRDMYKDIPIVVLSGHIESREKLEELGVSKIVEKPMSMEDLLNVIDKFKKG